MTSGAWLHRGLRLNYRRCRLYVSSGLWWNRLRLNCGLRLNGRCDGLHPNQRLRPNCRSGTSRIIVN